MEEQSTAKDAIEKQKQQELEAQQKKLLEQQQGTGNQQPPGTGAMPPSVQPPQPSTLTPQPSEEQIPKVTNEELKKKEEELAALKEELEKQKASLQAQEEALKKDKEATAAQKKHNEEVAKRLREETERLQRLEEVLRKRDEPEAFAQLEADMMEAAKGDMYSDQQRAQIKADFDVAVKNAQQNSAEMMRLSNIAGTKGLTKAREIALTRKVIENQSEAKTIYIRVCHGADREKMEYLLNVEERRKAGLLADLYRRFGMRKEAETQEKIRRDLWDKLLAFDVSKLIDLDDGDEDGTPEQEEKEAKKEEAKKKAKKQEKPDDTDQSPEDTEGLAAEVAVRIKNNAWITEAFQTEGDQKLFVICGLMNEDDRKKYRVKQQAGETPEKLNELRRALITHWQNTFKTQKLVGDERIPELQNNPTSEMMRLAALTLEARAERSAVFKERPKVLFEKKVEIPKNGDETEKKDKKPGDPDFDGYAYEVQDRENDCWSVAGAALVNFHRKKDEKKITQKDVRAVKPVFRSQYKDEQKNGYDEAVESVQAFTTANASEDLKVNTQKSSNQGNIFSLADFIMEQLPGFAMKRVILDIGQCKRDDAQFPGKKNAMHNVTEHVKALLQEKLSKGEPVAMLANGHYMLAVGADENGIHFLNSLGQGSHTTISFEKYLGDCDKAEIAWVEEAGSFESLAEKYEGLSKTDSKSTEGEIDLQADSSWAMKHQDMVAISKGVAVRAKPDSIPMDVRSYVSEMAVLPSALKAEKKKEESKPKEEEKKVEKKAQDDDTGNGTGGDGKKADTVSGGKKATTVAGNGDGGSKVGDGNGDQSKVGDQSPGGNGDPKKEEDDK